MSKRDWNLYLKRVIVSTLLLKSFEELVAVKFFQETNILLFVFQLWPKVLLSFHDTFSVVLPKLQIAILDGDFREWKCCSRKYFFLLFQDLEQTFSKGFVKSFGRSCQNCFQSVGKTLLTNVLVQKVFFLFSLDFSQKVFLHLLQKMCLAKVLSKWLDDFSDDKFFLTQNWL